MESAFLDDNFNDGHKFGRAFVGSTYLYVEAKGKDAQNAPKRFLARMSLNPFAYVDKMDMSDWNGA